MQKEGTIKNNNPPPALGLLAGVCLAANYYYFMIGLELTGPTSTAVIIQIAPLLTVIARIFVFKERINKGQLIGLFFSIFGFILFYLD